MTLYHGTDRKFDKFKTPNDISKMDVTKGGVVYLTNDINKAKKYGQFIAVVNCNNPVSYSEQRKIQGLSKKKGKYTTNVFVSLPENCKIIEWR